MPDQDQDDQRLIDEFRPAVVQKFPDAEAVLVDGGFFTIATGKGFSVGMGVRPATAWRSAAQTLTAPD